MLGSLLHLFTLTMDSFFWSLLFLVANALPHWLLKGTKASDKFFSAPHAVPRLDYDLLSRVVFARMKVVPGEAFPCNTEIGEGDGIKTFEQFFHDGPGMRSTELCPLAKPGSLALARSVEKQLKEQCDDGQAYCWMSCLDVPQECGETAISCKNQEDLPCCTDTVTENCLDMDPTCAW